MKILVLGCGLMGPAAAYDAMLDPEVSKVTITDLSRAQLDSCLRKFSRQKGAKKLQSRQMDLRNEAALADLMEDCDAVISAVPWSAAIAAINAAIKVHKPVVDFSWPADDRFPLVKREVERAGGLVIYNCGVEPGLSEIIARRLSEGFDRVDELHIECGGIPEKPTPPLGYRIVYGGRQMPFYNTDPFCVENGKLKVVPRYSGVQPTFYEGVGELEAWHEGFMPWLLDIPKLKNLRCGTQKTVRWPGYAAKATVLKELGLFSHKPVTVDGTRVLPKKVVDAVLYSRVKMRKQDRDITVFRVEMSGEKDGRPRWCKVEMVDHFDEKTGFTSMSRVTAFPAASVARMVARGDVKAKGMLTPEKVITGKLFDRLIKDLRRHNVLLEKTTRESCPL